MATLETKEMLVYLLNIFQTYQYTYMQYIVLTFGFSDQIGIRTLSMVVDITVGRELRLKVGSS